MLQEWDLTFGQETPTCEHEIASFPGLPTIQFFLLRYAKVEGEDLVMSLSSHWYFLCRPPMIPVIFIQRHGSEGLELMLDYPHVQYVLFTLSYLACTEEGYIHKCSCSYNEQVLETYTGHAVRKLMLILGILNCISTMHLSLWLGSCLPGAVVSIYGRHFSKL